MAPELKNFEKFSTKTSIYEGCLGVERCPLKRAITDTLALNNGATPDAVVKGARTISRDLDSVLIGCSAGNPTFVDGDALYCGMMIVQKNIT